MFYSHLDTSKYKEGPVPYTENYVTGTALSIEGTSEQRSASKQADKYSSRR
jgi:hypothetical protein